MSIRWVTSLLGLLLTVTIMVTAGLSWNVYSSFTKMVEADVQYLNLMQVSRELLQSSYDLTRKAREYVNTGDEASERAYYDILAQRSGRVPRKSSLAPGETISLPSLLERYGASRGDMEFLATALRRSDDLSITEIEAMQASKGEALCPDGLHSGSDTIDVEYARRLLFNAAYQKRAGEIIKLVESGITSILDRKSHQIEAYKRSVVYHMKELGASIAVVFLIALMWIWYGMKKVSQPLRETTLFAHRVAEGEAESSIAVSGHDEIAELRAMLNVMLSSLQKNALMLRELSYIDPLTALWNRRRFREVLSDELRRVQEEKGKGFGLAFIDVDCFKGINDTFGHAAGDMVLREFAKLARGMLPDSATFARLGGDEVVLLLPDAVLLSRRYGSACYCLAVCPLGLAANWLGKIAPWRIRRTDACMHCLACIRVCRYGALTPERLKEGRPGPGCTLCRDCLSVCRHGGLAVTLYGKTCGVAESSFVVLLSIMHTVFLAVARV